MNRPFREVGNCQCFECATAEQYRAILAELQSALRGRDKIIHDLRTQVADAQEDLFYWKEDLERSYSDSRE